MSYDFLSHVAAYATHSDTFGEPLDRGTLRQSIKLVPLGGLLLTLSQLMSFPINKSTLKTEFVRFVGSRPVGAKLIPRVREKIADKVLFTPQGLLTVWKWLLAYGEKQQMPAKVEVSTGIGQAIMLSMVVSDYLHVASKDPRPLKYEMLQNVSFNSVLNIYATLARTYYIFLKFASDKASYDTKEFVDIHRDFQSKYGFTIDQYLAATFAVLAPFLRKTPTVDDGSTWVKRVEFFSSTNLGSLVTRILRDEFCLTFDEGTEWAKKTLESAWDFSLFRRRPLFLENDFVFPISLQFLEDQLFWGLFQKIRQCYPEDDNKFSTFIGRAFEQYVSMAACEAVNNESPGYTVIPEFKYGKGKRSPDVMIRFGDKLLAVEAKTRRLTTKSRVDGLQDDVDEDLSKAIMAPLRQVHDRVHELLTQYKKPNLEGVSEVYLLTVSIGHVPTLPPFERDFQRKLNDYAQIPTRGFFHFDIEEFEMLCAILEQQGPARMFETLDNKQQRAPDLSFRNFAYTTGLSVQRPGFLERAGVDLLSHLQALLFREDGPGLD